MSKKYDDVEEYEEFEHDGYIYLKLPNGQKAPCWDDVKKEWKKATVVH